MAHYDSFAHKKVHPLSAAVIKLFYRKLERFITSRIGLHPGTNLLEIGGGKGDFACICRRLGIIYKVYEPNQLLCGELKALGFDAVCASVPPVADPDESFDCVALLNVLEHMPSAAVAEGLLHELHRVLRGNGVLFLICPNYLDWKSDFYNLDYTHSFPTTETSVRQLLHDTGFSSQKVAYHYGCFFSGFGRFANAAARCSRAAITLFFPRSVSRSLPIQKLGATFAENFMIIARKK